MTAIHATVIEKSSDSDRPSPASVIVLGTGRSGTSMVTKMFATTHYCGDDYIRPREANPTGFFEDSTVNQLNDRLLWRFACIGPLAQLRMPGVAAHRDRRALWLATPWSDLHVGLPARAEEAMRKLLVKAPFCYKDPRFSYTLRFWEPYLPPGTRKLVVFRHRDRTVESMQRELAEGYSPPVSLPESYLRLHWERTYRKLLQDAAKERDKWFFIDYDDVLSGIGADQLEAHIGCELSRSHIKEDVSRTAGSSVATDDCQVYQDLLRAASEDLRR